MEKNQSKIDRWLNRNVFAFGLTSLLSDFCHEMATAILPQFMQAIGSSAYVPGFIYAAVVGFAGTIFMFPMPRPASPV